MACCWHPDWDAFTERGQGPWTDATGGWVFLPQDRDLTSKDFQDISTGSPTFIVEGESSRGDAMRAWQIFQSAIAQKLSDYLSYAHFGERERLYAYRADFAHRRVGTIPVVIMKRPDEAPSTYDGKFDIVSIPQSDYDRGLPRICEYTRVVGFPGLSDWIGQQRTSHSDDELYDGYPKVECEQVPATNLPLQGGSWSLTIHFLTNHGSLMRIDFSMLFDGIDPVKDSDNNRGKIPVVYVAESDDRSASDLYSAATPNSPTYEQTITDELNSIYGDGYQKRWGIEILINEKEFLLIDNPSIVARGAHAITLGIFGDLQHIRRPNLDDFARQDLEVQEQFYKHLYFRPVQEWSAPNEFSSRPAG